jgi:hypothetical protein
MAPFLQLDDHGKFLVNAEAWVSEGLILLGIFQGARQPTQKARPILLLRLPFFAQPFCLGNMPGSHI